jgi:hypothetical protein
MLRTTPSPSHLIRQLALYINALTFKRKANRGSLATGKVSKQFCGSLGGFNPPLDTAFAPAKT